MKKLNLGCGTIRKPGFINVDWDGPAHPDVVHDLNVFPYPFADSEFDLIEADHVLEHLDRPFAVMQELHRILKTGGVLHIRVPHFSRGFTHAEHAHGFDITFPLYFRKLSGFSGYYGCEYALQSMRLRWLAFAHLLPAMGYGKSAVAVLGAASRFVSFFANASPAFCSRIWCYWVGGFDEIEFLFQKNG